MRSDSFVILTLTCVTLGGSVALGLDPIGPPCVDLDKGQLGAQAGYSYASADIDLTDGKWSEHMAGVLQDKGKAIDITIEDFKTHKVYAGLEFGADDNGTVFLRLGGTNATFGESIWHAGEELDGSIDLTAGCGAKATLLELDGFKLGVVVQASWSKFDGTLKADNWFTEDVVGVSLGELQIAAGAAHEYAKGRWIYGGPFVHYFKGDFEDTFTELRGTSGPVIGSTLSDWEYKWKINQGPIFGFFLGAKIELTEDSIVSLEYQYSSDTSVFGASLMLPY